MYENRIVVFFLLFFGSFLFAKELPKWVYQDPDNTGIYFRGSSPWYIQADALVSQQAKKDALADAYSKVSNYFGINISSSTIIQQTADANINTIKVKKQIQTKTNQLIFDLKPIKVYKELSDDEENFKIWVLIKLDPQIEAKIKAQMKKDQQEFQALQQQIIKALDQKDFYKAENLLAIAKGKRAAYIDNTINQLEERLKKLKEGLLQATIKIPQTTVSPNQEIQAEIFLNKTGYLYILYDTPTEVEMIFPTRYQRDNHLQKYESVFFPNEDFSIIAYDDCVDKEVYIIAIAAKKRLGLERFADEVVDGIFLFDKNNKKFHQAIKSCLEQAECFEKKQQIKIRNQVKVAKAKLIVYASENIKNQIFQSLQQEKIQFPQTSKKTVELYIQKKQVFSKLLQNYITQYSVKTIVSYNNKILKKEQKVFSYAELLSYIKEKLL